VGRWERPSWWSDWTASLNVVEAAQQQKTFHRQRLPRVLGAPLVRQRESIHSRTKLSLHRSLRTRNRPAATPSLLHDWPCRCEQAQQFTAFLLNDVLSDYRDLPQTLARSVSPRLVLQRLKIYPGYEGAILFQWPHQLALRVYKLLLPETDASSNRLNRHRRQDLAPTAGS